MSLVVIFPVGKEVEADAYLAFCTIHNPDTTPGGIWYENWKVDKFGQRVVGYQGPGGFLWNNEPIEEPVGGEAARAAGILTDTFEWPEVPDYE